VIPPRIVVVDDDDAVRSIVMAVAREAIPSASLTEHHSSLHALQEIHTGSADLLITNCHMPDMDGPTLVKTIREENNSIPIIMVSGSDDARELGEQAGVDRFVPKHTIIPELSAAIHSLMDAA
jgi:CheY-like chemotaxis protein